MFRSIRAKYCSWWLYPPKPTAADLDAAEAVLGFRFPASYRAFAEEFGLGASCMACRAFSISPARQDGARTRGWIR
jgi:hypothetical protein